MIPLLHYSDEEAARLCHEVIRALQDAYGQDVLPAWADYGEENRKAGIAHIAELRAKSVTPRQAHEEWAALRISKGWKYGPVKDSDAKTSPWLVPYDELPVTERAKDYVFQYLLAAMPVPAPDGGL